MRADQMDCFVINISISVEWYSLAWFCHRAPRIRRPHSGSLHRYDVTIPRQYQSSRTNRNWTEPYSRCQGRF